MHKVLSPVDGDYLVGIDLRLYNYTQPLGIRSLAVSSHSALNLRYTGLSRLGYLPAQKAKHTIPHALKLIGLGSVVHTLTQGRMKSETVNVD